MMKKTSGITLLVPVKDRPAYFSRLLSHLEYCASPHEIHVGDGSLDPTNRTRYEQLCERSSLPISYRRYGPDDSIPAFLSKMDQMASGVETDMAFLLSDDDFVMLPTLRTLAAEMVRHDASAAMGTVLDFHVRSHTSKVSGGMILSASDVDCGGRYAARAAITHKDPADRIRDAERFFPMEALLRSTVLKDATESCIRSRSFSTRHLHWAIQFQALLTGPILSYRQLLLLRQNDTDHHAGSLVAKGGPDSWTTVFDPEYQMATRECLAGLKYPGDSPRIREEVAWQYADMLRRRGRLLLSETSGPTNQFRRLSRGALRRAGAFRRKLQVPTDADVRAGAQAAFQQLDELDLELGFESRGCARAAVRATASA